MDDKEQETRRPVEESESLSRVGSCLHASFTADNHDSLGDDSTRSLLHLSREEKAAPMRVRLACGSASLFLPWR